MKRAIPLFLLPFLILCCSQKEPQMETMSICSYSTKIELGELVKDKIKSKYSIGFYPNGTQKYFVGLQGYEPNNDTTKYAEGVPYKIKKIDNKTFSYDEKDELKWVSVTKGDTIFSYEGNDLETPKGYSVFDSKKRLIAEVDPLMNEKKIYTQAKYNKYGACTYAIIQSEYEPSEFDKKYYSELVLAKRTLEKKETTFFEAEYSYY